MIQLSEDEYISGITLSFSVSSIRPTCLIISTLERFGRRGASVVWETQRSLHRIPAIPGQDARKEFAERLHVDITTISLPRLTIFRDSPHDPTRMSY